MIIQFISFLFDAIILIIYFKKMLGNRKDTIPTFLYVFLFTLCELTLFLFGFLFDNIHTNYRLYITILVSFLTTFLLTFLHKTNLRHRLFVSISFQIYATVSEFFVYLIYSFLPKNISEGLLSNDSYGSICSKIILFIMLNITILFGRKKKEAYSLQYSILVLIMPILSIVLLITIPIQNTTNTTQNVLSMIGMIGILLANIANSYLLDNILKLAELQQIDIQQKQQLEYQATKYQQISTTYRISRKLIHDMKKHFFFISNCVKSNEIDAITPYINNAIQDIEQSHNRVNTGNLVIDAFVSNHMTIAEQENIEFFSDIQITTNNVQIRDYDLSIILGNLLDNALNACRKVESPAPRQIAVELFTTNMEFVIHIANSVSEKQISTNKNISDDLYHGFGTKNVEAIVNKHMGTYTHYMEEEQYHCIVALPCNVK